MIASRPSQQCDKWIGQRFLILIYRPIGSYHPDHPTLQYKLNYGHVPGTIAADGEKMTAICSA